LSRKLAPPPKPKRDSNMASSAPPELNADSPDLLSSSALKAPLPPSISYSADDTAKMQASSAVAEPLELGADASTSLSQPPPIPRRRSYPAFPPVAVGELAVQGSARTPSDAAHLASLEPLGRASLETPPKGVSGPPRPISAAPRPRSDSSPAQLPRSDSSPAQPAQLPHAGPPPAGAAPASAPPSSSAIFAMRIIAVGDSVRPPAVQENVPDLDPDSYPPSASRLGTSVRRSSRPVIAVASPVAEAPSAPPLPTAVKVPEPLTVTDSGADPALLSVPAEQPARVPEAVAAPALLDVPPPLPALLDVPPPPPALLDVPPPPLALLDVPPPPLALLDAVEDEDIPIEVEAPVLTSSPPPPAGVRPPPPPPPVELGAVPREELREVLGEDLPPQADKQPEAEELGREDAISLPPEELAALKAELEAKAEAVKPPPPPKRTTGVGIASLSSASSGAEFTPKEAPPTPDLAAAKAAQRAKTRQPWWEDLFNEDFMRLRRPHSS
jgi:hypothetical protein